MGTGFGFGQREEYLLGLSESDIEIGYQHQPETQIGLYQTSPKISDINTPIKISSFCYSISALYKKVIMQHISVLILD